MATKTSFNKNNSAIKRIMQEARELSNDPSTEYTAAPLEDNLFEWHCTLRGAPETEFEGGLYHFRIVLPAEYPFRPPSLMMLTPSGRFETNTKLCISFTNYHEELWQPAWGVRTAIIGLQGFFPLKGQAAVGVGSLESTASERRRLAKLSREWICPHCKVPNRDLLKDLPSPEQQAASSSQKISGEINGSSEEAPATATESETAKDTSAEAPFTSPNANVLASSIQRVSHPPQSEGQNEMGSGEARVSAAEDKRTFARETGVSAESDDSQRRIETVEVVSASPSPISTLQRASNRPPFLLDASITVLLVLVAALICRKLL